LPTNEEFEVTHLKSLGEGRQGIILISLCEDDRLSDRESSFRVFNANLDIVIHQLSNRFKGLRATSSLIDSIHPTTLANADDDALYETASRLAEHYSKDISASFPGQLFSFGACFKKEMAKRTTVRDLAKMLIVDYNSVTATFGEVVTACSFL
jgi:hypothetical protein